MSVFQACNACLCRTAGRFGIELLLIALIVFQCLGFIGTYIIAVCLHHVTPGLPYISDTGGKPPESCVFTFVCCVSGIIVLMIVFIRYQHVHQYSYAVFLVKWINIISFIFGMISVLGLILVGSFQDDEVAIGHFTGAMLVFVAGVIYMWLQTVLTCALTRHYGSVVIMLRLLLSILCSLMLVATIALGLTASHFRHHNENVGDGGGSFKWLPHDGGFPLHLASTITEWGLGLGFLLYFVTFHSEFSRLTVRISIIIRAQDPEQLTETTPLML